MRADSEKFYQGLMKDLGSQIPELLQMLEDEDRYDEFMVKEGTKIQTVAKEDTENNLSSDNRLGGFKIEPEKLRK
jgi:cytochrome c556